MPTNYTGRLITIGLIVWAALSAIFPTVPPSMFWFIRPSTQISLEPNLKPGIDMVGGTSLLYEIKQPEGGYFSSSGRTLAEEVMDSLKKRVDPQGVRNLIWRPQGNSRLEIQMPLTGASGIAKDRREEFGKAQRALEATNVRVSDVITAADALKGAERDARLEQLAMGSGTRKALFEQLKQASDEVAAARASNDAARQAQAETKYDELKEQIDRTNVSSQRLQGVLDLQGDSRAKALKNLRDRAADFPAQLKAIDDFEASYAEYAKVRSTIDDAGELKRLLRGSGVLSFHIQAIPPGMGAEPTISAEDYATLTQRLEKDGPQVRAGDEVKWFVVDKPDEFKGQTQVYNEKHYVLAYITPERSMLNRPGAPAWGLDRAYAIFEQGANEVGFDFNPAGAKLFGDLTGANIGKNLGIVLDDKMISAPVIRSQIMGRGTISGKAPGFTGAEQRYLISTLGAGSLPARLTDEPISERTVGPQLGADNLRAGFAACIVGMIVVAIFLIGYYYLAGLVAYIAVCINIVLILGVMAAFSATFTLPGIAGIVLSVGAAVDSNVLIFERLREEQHRGLSLRMALRNSYDRAWSAIVDSNMTTVITAAILYWLGTEEVKGFGITLLIGLVSSLFTSLFVTKTIFAILIDRVGITDLRSLPRTFPKWDQMLQPRVDWIRKSLLFATVSATVLLVGFAAFVHYGRKGQLLDIEFASGTAVQFDLREPMRIEEVRRLLPQDHPALPAPAVVSVGTDDRSYEVVTTSADAVKVKEVILNAFGERLALERPSVFDQVGAKPEDVMDHRVLPVVPDRTDALKAAADGFLPGNWQTYRGGAAIVLKNIEPKLTPKQIRDRIDRQRLQPTPGQSQVYRDFAVESPLGTAEPTALAVVFVADPLIPFDRDPLKWREELAAPSWKLLGDAINKPATLSKVSNFDAQVAGDTQRNALLALMLSLAVIVGYIWVRFGNLRYGTATMVAMLHATLIVLALIGISHLVVQFAPALAAALLLDPFRLNITLVAAILTVMGYSMMDTIVVFDRVRENRGKLGHLDRNVVNDSINQTMSRTLLTAGTNIVTLFFMYCFGGPGIHGFTFVLLFGILAGTYSTIAVAAPVLLVWLRERRPAGTQATGKKPAPAGQLQRVGG
jgi:SecD/SecF fusion protein